MPGTQQPIKFDVLRNGAQHILGFFRRRDQYFSSPSDGLFLKLHYKYTFWVLMAGFCGVYYNWMTNDIIRCVSHFNSDVQVRGDYTNLCLSYPFIVKDGRRITLLYYHWLHWVLLLCALAYIIPHKMAKVQRYDKINKLMEFMSQKIFDYGSQEKNMLQLTARFFATEVGGQNGLFYRYVGANITALAITLVVFFSLDGVLLGNFLGLGVDAFPMTVSRDGQNLTDPLTKAFQPFVDCEINDIQALTNKRDEHFGCHLTAQEFYEKIFLFIWYWMIGLMVAQTIYILFLFCFFCQTFRRCMIKRFLYNEPKLDETLDAATEKFSIGDWFVLYKIRVCFYYDGFNHLLEKMANRDHMQKYVEMHRKDIPNLPFKSHAKGILIE